VVYLDGTSADTNMNKIPFQGFRIKFCNGV
jgi:hypothetical protein